jgi:protein SCO1/2
VRAPLFQWLKAWLLAALLVAAPGWSKEAAPLSGKDVTALKLGRVFHLTDHHGKRRTLADFRGKAVLLFFGYTHCPDVCPTTLIRMSETLKLLGLDAAKVQVLWVTIDPERDSQALLANFVPAFNASMLGLRGTLQETDAFASAFQVQYDITTYKDQILVSHSTFGYLIDPGGRTRVKIGLDATPEQIAADVRGLLDVHR